MTVRAQLDSTVRCQSCGHATQVNFGECLRDGWPSRCSQTMRLEHTDADVELAVKSAVAGARQVIRRCFEVTP